MTYEEMVEVEGGAKLACWGCGVGAAATIVGLFTIATPGGMIAYQLGKFATALSCAACAGAA